MRFVLILLLLLAASLAGCASEDPGDHAGDHADDEDSMDGHMDGNMTLGNETGNETSNATVMPTVFTFVYNMTGDFAPVVVNFTVEATGGFSRDFSSLTVDLADEAGAQEIFEPEFPLTFTVTYEAAGNYTPYAVLNEDGKESQRVDLSLNVAEKPAREIPASLTAPPSVGCATDFGMPCVGLIDGGALVGSRFELGPEHWGLLASVSSDSLEQDSECIFFDADGEETASVLAIGECVTQIPDGTASVYLWHWVEPAFGMVLNFSEA